MLETEKNTGSWMRFVFLLAGSLFLPPLALHVYAAGEYAVSSGKAGNTALVYGAVAVMSVLLLWKVGFRNLPSRNLQKFR